VVYTTRRAPTSPSLTKRTVAFHVVRCTVLHVNIFAFFHAKQFRRQDQEKQVEQDTHDRGKHNRRDTVREQDRDLEGEKAVGQAQVTADARDQDDRANR
jgi:hypothetical protein